MRCVRGPCFPRLYAAASLKRPGRARHPRDPERRFPRLYAAASLKRGDGRGDVRSRSVFSAALCRGLIEARLTHGRPEAFGVRFPRLYAAASLKRKGLVDGLHEVNAGFPRLYAAASLKQRIGQPGFGNRKGFPRLYAAASLKRLSLWCSGGQNARFSAALCRGLIEARRRRRGSPAGSRRFPRLYAAASLKPRAIQDGARCA